jgi:hypothetical protein
VSLCMCYINFILPFDWVLCMIVYWTRWGLFSICPLMIDRLFRMHIHSTLFMMSILLLIISVSMNYNFHLATLVFNTLNVNSFAACACCHVPCSVHANYWLLAHGQGIIFHLSYAFFQSLWHLIFVTLILYKCLVGW